PSWLQRTLTADHALLITDPWVHFVRLCPGYVANSLGDLRRTRVQGNRVLSVHDRPCPSLAAGAHQINERAWRTGTAFCPPLASAIAMEIVCRSRFNRPARITHKGGPRGGSTESARQPHMGSGCQNPRLAL